jgi:hypothetical protein
MHGPASPHTEIGIRKQAPLRVIELPAPDNGAGAHDALIEAERTQHAHTIRVDDKSSSGNGPRRLPLDQLRREAVPMKCCSGREASDAAADDQDLANLCHDCPGSRG